MDDRVFKHKKFIRTAYFFLLPEIKTAASKHYDTIALILNERKQTQPKLNLSPVHLSCSVLSSIPHIPYMILSTALKMTKNSQCT